MYMFFLLNCLTFLTVFASHNFLDSVISNAELRHTGGVILNDFTESKVYVVSPADRNSYEENGFLKLENVIPEDVLLYLDEVFDDILNNYSAQENFLTSQNIFSLEGEINGNFLKDYGGFTINEISKHYRNNTFIIDNLINNVLQPIINDLFGYGLVFHEDKFVSKNPYFGNNFIDSSLFWHQDIKYCKRKYHKHINNHGYAVDTRVGVIRIALNKENENNGCARYVKGSHKLNNIRNHLPLNLNNDKEYKSNLEFLKSDINQDDKQNICNMKLNRGDISIHNEYTLHSSGINYSKNSRTTYIVSFRTPAEIAVR